MSSLSTIPNNCLHRLLLALPPEAAHHAALSALRTIARRRSTPLIPPMVCSRTVMGLPFANPLGLAAGFDKNADSADGLAQLGFGFIESGAITPQPQSGNPPPRLYRLPQQQALINRMGFNNCGMRAAAQHLSSRRGGYILGINLGKNAQTELSNAADDYMQCMDALYLHADFFTINISSPNTVGLRDLQSPAALSELLNRIIRHRDALAKTHNKKMPMVVKLSPDLSDVALAEAANVIADNNMDGVIACNTTLARPPNIRKLPASHQIGGLSGAPLRQQSLHVLETLRKTLPDNIALIASGGVMHGDDVRERLSAGASLVQLYTGLIYGGPLLPRRILSHLQ